MASISMMVMEPMIWAKDHNHLVDLKIHALLCALLGIVAAWYMAKGYRIVLLASTFLQLILGNMSGVAEARLCFRRARDREVDVGNGVCKLQAGLASAMLVHLVLSMCILLIWRNGEHPNRRIVKALQTGWARSRRVFK
jgi:small-conductance mechanosensitive channel